MCPLLFQHLPTLPQMPFDQVPYEMYLFPVSIDRNDIRIKVFLKGKHHKSYQTNGKYTFLC